PASTNVRPSSATLGAYSPSWNDSLSPNPENNAASAGDCGVTYSSSSRTTWSSTTYDRSSSRHPHASSNPSGRMGPGLDPRRLSASIQSVAFATYTGLMNRVAA